MTIHLKKEKGNVKARDSAEGNRRIKKERESTKDEKKRDI